MPKIVDRYAKMLAGILHCWAAFICVCAFLVVADVTARDSAKYQNRSSTPFTITFDHKLPSGASLSVDVAQQSDIKPAVTLENDRAIRSLAFSSDGSVLVSGGGDFSKVVKVWNTSTWKTIDQFEAHSNCVFTVCVIDKKGKKIITSGDDDTVKFWDRGKQTVVECEFEKWCATVSPCKQFMAVGNLKGRNAILSTGIDVRGNSVKDTEKQFGTVIHKLQNHPAARVAFSRDSKFLATGGFDNRVVLWDVRTGEQLQVFGKANMPELPPPNGKFVMSIDFSFDNEYLAVGSTDGSCKVWKLNGKELVSEWRVVGSGGVSQAVFLNDNKTVVASTPDGFLRTWCLGKNAPMQEIKAHTGICWKVIVTPNNKMILTAGEDGFIKGWLVNDLLGMK